MIMEEMREKAPSRAVVFCALLLAVVFSACSNNSSSSSPSVIALGGPDAAPDGSFDYDLTLLFTNDIHDQILAVNGKRGGLARMATLLRLLREQATERGKGTLTLNAGDNWEGSLFYEADGGVIIFQLLDAMGYDVVQVGNHDHQFGVGLLYSVLAQAFVGLNQRLRLLFGNVNPAGMSAIGTDPAAANAAFLPAQVPQAVIDAFENSFSDYETGAIDGALMDAPLANSYLFNQTLFYEINGIRIGVFGLDTDENLYSSVPGQGELFLNADGRSENLRFYPPVNHSYASDVLSYLSDPDQDPGTDDGADLIVCVTHIGFLEDQALATSAVSATGRRIDVIVGGHSHTKLNTAVPVDHGAGQTTWIVQAGSRGEFVGRLDLSVDPQTNAVAVKNAQLLQVDDRLPDDPAAAALINQAILGTGGVNELFLQPFDTLVGTTPNLLTGTLAANTALGGFTADALRAAGAFPALGSSIDVVMFGNFTFRSDLCAGAFTVADVHGVLPLHNVDLTGRQAETIDFVDLPGGLRAALDPSTFPLPGFLTNITALEYFLEIVFSLEDVLGIVGQFLQIEIADLSDIITGFQWAGIEFEVDADGPAMNKIDPATIFLDGAPLVGNENQPVRVALSSILARQAIPFVQLLSQIEEPAGSNIFLPFPDYDPAINGTTIEVWRALRDALALANQNAQTVTLNPQRARSRAPDLTFEAASVTVDGTPAAGATLTVTIPVLNLGSIAATSAVLEARIDLTPNDHTDDPDGVTDTETGFSYPLLGSSSVPMVSGYANGASGVTSVQLSIALPNDLAPGTAYPLFLTLSGVVSADPTRPERVVENNGGPAYAVTVTIP